MILDIIKYDDTNFYKLKVNNIDVKKENPFLQSLIDNMFETLNYNKTCLGLSAPQVGHNLNLFVIKMPGFQEVFINPVIQLDGVYIQNKEKCLSIPGMEFPVDRKQIVKIKYYDRNWTLRVTEFKDQLSIIVQHEYDHIKGKLIID